MNKTALKNFATSARRELLQKVEARALKLGITADSIKKAEIESSDAIYIDGKQLDAGQRQQRNALIARIKDSGFERVMEEVAYTWFNRFTALRFMEVNDYLPTKVRVLSSTNPDSAEPDMIKEAMSLDLDIDKEHIYNLKMENKTEELFKYLIIKHCNDLNRYMPFMFEKINHYTEILFPEGLLATDSFIRQMTDTEAIPEEDWEKIEVIGWLYQYYIAEEKDRVFKAKKKYKAEEIPFATQLFTPDWIVHYMVQNSLGKYWVEAHPEHKDLKNNWEFYIENEQEDFQEKIAPYINKDLNVEEIKCLDPAMGSGHILVYMFDVLYEIYSKCGYTDREIPRLIIENNLYGLDIDDRAYQLACFSVVMKAMQYNRRFLRSIERYGIELNLVSIQETNGLTDEDIAYIAGEHKGENYEKAKTFIEQFKHGKTIGSLLKLTETETAFLEERLQEIKATPAQDIFQEESRERILTLLPQLIKQTKIMGQQYDVVAMNPPYMGSRSMNKELSDYLRTHYPDSKADLFATFMEVNHLIKETGLYAAINQHAWMFLSSFEKLREKIINNKLIDTMLHLGPRAFEEIGGEVVQSTAFILRNMEIDDWKGIYIKLIDSRTATEKRKLTLEAVQNPNVEFRYTFRQKNFVKIPNKTIAYWIPTNLIGMFEEKYTISNDFEVRNGITTGENDIFIRFWYEVNINKKSKWFPCNKGGSYRKWYGNYDFLIDWENNGLRLKTFKDKDGKLKSTLRSIEFNFKEAITMSRITTSGTSYRWLPLGFITEGASNNIYFRQSDKNNALWLLGLLNTKISDYIMRIYNPTINIMPNDIRSFPIKRMENTKSVVNIVKKNISISKRDWDDFETSWDFNKHPIILYSEGSTKLSVAYENWKLYSSERFTLLKKNEEELNRIFIEIYGLEDEMSPEVPDEDVTVRQADLERDVKSFISYAIGCSFGRYSLDEEGLVYAGGEFDESRYMTFPADQNNILPILPGAYFEDDIVSRFVEFVRVTFGEEMLEENLEFVADAIGRRKSETARECLRRYFLNNFYKDHVQTYKKRPIYWLFTSGKEKAFNCLIYMHRYDKTTLSRIRTDYLHDYQIRLDAERQDLLNIMEGDSSAREINQAKRELKSLDKKIDELKKYDELLHHMADMQIEIDLDDGVKVNYEKFKGLVAKI